MEQKFMKVIQIIKSLYKCKRYKWLSLCAIIIAIIISHFFFSFCPYIIYRPQQWTSLNMAFSWVQPVRSIAGAYGHEEDSESGVFIHPAPLLLCYWSSIISPCRKPQFLSGSIPSTHSALF